MLAIYACTAADLRRLAGRSAGAILALLGWPRPGLARRARPGFAALVVVAPFLLRLPGPGDDRGVVIVALRAGRRAPWSCRATPRRAGGRDRAGRWRSRSP